MKKYPPVEGYNPHNWLNVRFRIRADYISYGELAKIVQNTVRKELDWVASDISFVTIEIGDPATNESS